MADSRTLRGTRPTGSPAPSRLPSTRERRPALAAAAVLLIVGGAFSSGWLALQSGHREDYLQLRSDIAPGQQIGSDDLMTVSLPENLDGVIPAAAAGEVEGRHAVTRLLPGTILRDNMLTDSSGVPPGQQELALSVSPESLPDGLANGSLVAVNIVPTAAGDPSGTYLATVTSIALPDSGGSGLVSGGPAKATVNVALDDACAAAVAAATANDSIVLGGKTSLGGKGVTNCTLHAGGASPAPATAPPPAATSGG